MYVQHVPLYHVTNIVICEVIRYCCRRSLVIVHSFSCSTMPVLKIITNLSRDKIPADFLDKATEFLAKLLEKDKKVWHNINSDHTMNKMVYS